jgi:hypothetical protein
MSKANGDSRVDRSAAFSLMLPSPIGGLSFHANLASTSPLTANFGRSSHASRRRIAQGMLANRVFRLAFT